MGSGSRDISWWKTIGQFEQPLSSDLRTDVRWRVRDVLPSLLLYMVGVYMGWY